MKFAKTKTDDWSLAEKVLFRFFFLFFVLNSLPWLFNLFYWLPGRIANDNFILNTYRQLWKNLVLWVSTHLLKVDVGENYNSDSLFHYTEVLTTILTTFIGCIIWSISDRKRSSYRTLLYWLTVYVRYSLAYAMVGYGFSKVFLLQFNSRFGDLEYLLKSFGDLHPSELFARFMGYSKHYQFFTGIAEVIGGLLLLFRRTMVLGALIVIGVMANVFMLNRYYGFGVTLTSLQLVVMAVFLLVIDGQRVRNFFIFNKTVPPLEPPSFLPKKWMRITKVVLKAYFIFFICLYSGIKPNLEYYIAYVAGPNPPLYGIYRVDTFVLNQDTLAGTKVDSTRWNRFVVSFPGWVHIHLMNDSVERYDYRPDTVQKRLTLVSFSDTLDRYTMTYSEPQKDILLLQGKWKEDSAFIRMQKEDLNRFPLVRTKTQWIKPN